MSDLQNTDIDNALSVPLCPEGLCERRHFRDDRHGRWSARTAMLRSYDETDNEGNVVRVYRAETLRWLL